MSNGNNLQAVFGCAPQTTYYFRVHARIGEEADSWPKGGPAEVVTASENAFISDSRQLLVSISNPKENFDATGWLVLAGTDDCPTPISAYVGDGAAPNQAYLNLGHLFGPDGRNWMPTGLQTIRLTLLGNDSGPVVHSIPLAYTGEFQTANGTAVSWDVSDVLLGDVNNDKRIDLADAILALQVVQRIKPAQTIFRKADVNNDGKIGIEEAIFVLRFILQTTVEN